MFAISSFRPISRSALICLICLALAGCDFSSSVSCNASDILGTATLSCTGSVGELADSKTLDFEFSDGASVGLTVNADVTVTVESGRVRVSYDTGNGDRVSAEAAPGAPARLTQPIDVLFIREMRVLLEAIDGTATKISYTANFNE